MRPTATALSKTKRGGERPPLPTAVVTAAAVAAVQLGGAGKKCTPAVPSAIPGKAVAPLPLPEPKLCSNDCKLNGGINTQTASQKIVQKGQSPGGNPSQKKFEAQ